MTGVQTCALPIYPLFDSSIDYSFEAKLVSTMQEAVRLVRNVRGDIQIPLDKKIHVVIRPDSADDAASFMEEKKSLFAGFMTCDRLEIDTDRKLDVKNALPVAGSGFNVFVFVKDAINVDDEISKLEKDIAKNKASLTQTLAKLSNEKFVNNAKPEVIEKEKGKQAEFEEKIQKAEQHIKALRSF